MFSIKFKSSASQNNFSQSILILEKFIHNFIYSSPDYQKKLEKLTQRITTRMVVHTNENNLLEI